MVKVACCWDDGVINDIRLMELLRKYNAKATFNLNPGLLTEDRGTPCWLPVEKAGQGHFGFSNGKVGLHEIVSLYGEFKVASHGWLHKNAAAVPEEEFLRDAIDAKKYLEDVFQRECPGFAWPYGGVSTESLLDKMTAAGFKYGRTTREAENRLGQYTHPMMLNPTVHFQNQLFYEKFLEAKAVNGVFYFWGHSYEMMDCDGLWNQLENKLAMFARDPEVEWIDVIDIVDKG